MEFLNPYQVAISKLVLNKKKFQTFLACYAFLSLLLLWLSTTSSAVAQNNKWSTLIEDLEVMEVESYSYWILPNKLTFFRTELKHLRPGVVRAVEFGSRRSDVKNLVRESKAILGINANFFDKDGLPLGLIVSRGNVFNRIHRGGNTLTGIFAVSNSGPVILNRFSFLMTDYFEALQAGPRLIHNSKPVSGLKSTSEYSRRSGVCIDNSSRLIFYASRSGASGHSIDQLLEILQRPEINCREALNLDGGGSTQLYLRLPDSSDNRLPRYPEADNWKELSIEGTDLVPVMLGLFLPEPRITPLENRLNRRKK